MKVSEKVVFTLGDIKVVREQGYGFRCNSLSTSWSVYKNGQPVGSYSTLLRARDQAERLAN
jgi:hypothetical protein